MMDSHSSSRDSRIFLPLSVGANAIPGPPAIKAKSARSQLSLGNFQKEIVFFSLRARERGLLFVAVPLAIFCSFAPAILSWVGVQGCLSAAWQVLHSTPEEEASDIRFTHQIRLWLPKRAKERVRDYSYTGNTFSIGGPKQLQTF